MLNLYTRFVANFLFPLHERLKKHSTVSVRKNMEETQWLPAGEINAIQIKRLQELMLSVNEHVPYYQKLFKELNLDSLKIASVDDLQKIPFLTKELIRDNIEELKANNAGNLSRFNTGGSSGAPLVFYIGKERVSHDVAAKWRATRWWGVDIGDPEVVVWGSPIELGGQDRVKLIRDKLLRTKLISAFEMSEENLDQFINEIVKIKPKMLFGYPSSLSLIAEHAKKKNIDVSNLGVKVAFVTSEKLYDHQREKIEKTFSCRVANGYGGRDAGFIAHECPAGNMHITAEDIVVEIVGKGGENLPIGESGEIVVTHLATKDYPFIRYRTGDIGILSDELCVCGRALPVLKEIQGRTTDFIIAHDGTIMHGLALIYVIRDVQGVKQFKIVQESLDKTVVYITPTSNYALDNDEHIVNNFKQRLGFSVNVEVVKTSNIPSEKSGKFRYIVSHVERHSHA